jgi:OMF family outer membrane factor
MLRRFTISIILGGLFTLPAWSGEVYTREKAVQIALEKSSDIQTAQQNVKAAESKVNGAYGNAYPSIDLSATYARSFGVDDVEYTDINSMLDEQADANDKILASIMSPMLYGVQASQGFRWGTQVGLTATQILFAQGKVSTGVKIAKAYKRSNEIALDKAKEDVRYDVETAFDQVLYLDSAVAIYEASIEQANKHLDYVKKANESGLLGELDMIRAQIQVDELTSGLEKTKKNQIIAKNSLLHVMGLPWESDVQFEGNCVTRSNRL